MKLVSATTVKNWLSDEDEIAFIDVREHGQYGDAHPFFVSSVPFSRLEILLPQRVPNPHVKLVLIDNADGVAERAAQAAGRLGYDNIYAVEGGAPGWQQAGYTLYSGVNVPSKTFAEVMEHKRNTPAMSAQAVADLTKDGTPHTIVDGRPLTEFEKFSIPGAVCCPNGELALRISELVDDTETTIVINCAGRTRSIIGAQTLIDAGIKNPVFALENGTQGWVLAGLERAHGASDQYPEIAIDKTIDQRRNTIRDKAVQAGVQFVASEQINQWLMDSSRSTYLLDVRTPEEFANNGSPLSVHAPGGQLVQGTDQWVGIRGARLVLIDDEQVRAPMTAYWLAQMGHQVFVLEGGVSALQAEACDVSVACVTKVDVPKVDSIDPDQLDPHLTQLVDLRGSMAFRKQHIEGASWSVRPLIESLNLLTSVPVVLIGDASVVGLVGHDLSVLGFDSISHLTGDANDWQSAGLNLVSSDSTPADADCIDHLFFTAQRHIGNEADSRQYLDWEVNLVNQLDDQERAVFTVMSA